MNERENSIFREFYTPHPFIDRFLKNPEKSVDVIIPIIHTNEFWEANLLSFYREISIHKLLIGDGGCIDDSIEIVQKFPRVQIFNHRNFQTLGYSIRNLIEEVETEWFIYVHSDAYLPTGWFDMMYKHQAEYDWFGSKMQNVYMVEFDNDYGDRPWAGTQMGRKIAFDKGLNKIDDDYVYRQEDFIFSEIVKKAGFKEGKVSDTLHYHQTIRKATPWARKIKRIQFDLEMSTEEEIRTCETTAKGIIKYLNPPKLLGMVIINVNRLQEMGVLDWNDFLLWTEKTNPSWLHYFNREKRFGFFSLSKRILNYFMGLRLKFKNIVQER